MALSNNLTTYTAALAKLPQQRIAQVISALLLLYIAFMAAKITWLVVPQKTAVNEIVSSQRAAQQSQGGQSVNLSALQALNLFGKYNDKPVVETVVEQITDAPETRLQLTLSGLVASDDVGIAAAIIENNKKQATYGIGDIITGTRASLEQVLIDRVIIKQSGRLETLMLDGADYNQAAQSVATKQAQNKASKQASQSSTGSKKEASPSKGKASVVDQRRNQTLSDNAKRLRADIANNPGKITDYLRISPVRKDGAIAGISFITGQRRGVF